MANWPPDLNAVRAQLGYGARDGSDDDLRLYISAAADLIDLRTGRKSDPTRWVDATSGDVPAIFVLAARETVKLWWRQSFNGPRQVSPLDPGGGADTAVPMGATLPARVLGWLEPYLATEGIG